eukprot:CAMPEP_0170369136 /NCGR_PEP_ID=MMETSP0117_2-20130122/7822_1 /TAXON_ID=400756 /ORGANISM="Durinskia baltica, Strain CSIRO CS-38" /LENGTH=471 /DNA_ID=CAMNT_0010623835 /DNA_START=73 /DNA_END=1488 /DNA_ORIENTATION=-
MTTNQQRSESEYAKKLFEQANEQSLKLFSREFADSLDKKDDLASFRSEFTFPKRPDGSDMVYFCGNSLGLQPKNLRKHVMQQLDKWDEQGVEGHFTEPTPWMDIDTIVTDSMAKLVGGLPDEVVMMNGLTCNLHLMMASFFRPTATRYKIMIEKKAFPSDTIAVTSQLQLHNLDPATALIEVAPREGETSLRMEDIEAIIAEEGQSIALVMFSGIQYYTGQLFDMARITVAAQAQGCKVGFDLAHAVGNVPLQLHDWGCDFACWCTYKYMNCGPGSIGGCFVHNRHGYSGRREEVINQKADGTIIAPEPLRMAGWWGHRRDDRFAMEPNFIPADGVNGFRMSNPPVLLMACVRASLDLFDQATMSRLRQKSLQITAYLEQLLITQLADKVHIFTPVDPHQRGCQLSLSFPCCQGENASIDVGHIVETLNPLGVICDARKPDVIRIAPAPLYNSYGDVYELIVALKKALENY